MVINWDKINEQMLIYKDNSSSESEREKARTYVWSELYSPDARDFFLKIARKDHTDATDSMAAELRKKERFEDEFENFFLEFVSDQIEKYDPQRNPNFAACFCTFFKWRKNDIIGKQYKFEDNTERLDVPLSGGAENIGLIDTIPADDNEAVVTGIDSVVKNLLLMAKTVRLKQKTAEGARAMAECRYMGIFYTDTVCASVIDHMDVASPLARHNADVFKAIDDSLLDFITEEEYREIIKLVNARLKRMQDLPGLETESGTVRLPLELKVYSAFMKKAGAPADISTISKRRDKYKDEWREILFKED